MQDGEKRGALQRELMAAAVRQPFDHAPAVSWDKRAELRATFRGPAGPIEMPFSAGLRGRREDEKRSLWLPVLVLGFSGLAGLLALCFLVMLRPGVSSLPGDWIEPAIIALIIVGFGTIARFVLAGKRG